jgi:hypothetical protein
MMPVRAMRIPSLLGLMLALVGCSSALAQGSPIQPIVQVSAIGEIAPAFTAGARWTYTPVPVPVRDTTGMIRPVEPGWSFQLLATAGVTFAKPRGSAVDFTALASAGALHPIGAGVASGVGPVVMGSFRPNAIGAGVRAESSYKVLGVQVGALWFADRRNVRAAASADLTLAYLCDLFNCRKR